MRVKIGYVFLMLLLCLMSLVQCTKVTGENGGTSLKPLASPFTLPAPAYLAMAQKQTGDERAAMLMMASGRLIYAGQWRQGSAILTQTGPLTGELATEKHLLLAKIELMRNQPRTALAQLAQVQSTAGLPLFYQIQYHDMLAMAYQALGQNIEAVRERIKLEPLLPDETAKANNRRVLWLALTTLPAAELHALAMEIPDNNILAGWVQLAEIARSPNNDAQTMVSQIEQWQTRYPQHPANAILPTPLESIKTRITNNPRHIAVLLPLSGSLGGPGNAIKDGFMAAYEASGRADYVKVQTYDTNTAAASNLYQQAIQNGADYIIGPLSKNDVAAVASMDHPVPTLLLNDVDGTTRANAYQFGLSPTNEARQVAVKAHKDGLQRALIIAPAGAWGDAVVNAFASQWRASGGQVVDSLRFAEHNDFNADIRDLLQINASEARQKQMRRLLGSHIETTPERRQDFDMVFLVAYPSKARQIMPLLKYYYTGDVPVYATSTVYAGSVNTMKDRDLDGIIFSDMPWVFTHQTGNHNWPEQYNSYNRLYALGMDSFALATQLNQLLLFPALGVNDNSGILYLSSPHQIARILVFGQFRQGVAQQIGVREQ